MDVWVVELDYGRDQHHEVIGVAASRDLAKRIAEEHAAEDNPGQLIIWDWKDHDEDYGSWSVCNDYSVDPFSLRTA